MKRQAAAIIAGGLVDLIEELPDEATIISAEILSRENGTIIHIHLYEGIKSTAKKLGLHMTVTDAGEYRKMQVRDKHGLYEIMQLSSKRKAAPGVTSTEGSTAGQSPTEDTPIIGE